MDSGAQRNLSNKFQGRVDHHLRLLRPPHLEVVHGDGPVHRGGGRKKRSQNTAQRMNLRVQRNL